MTPKLNALTKKRDLFYNRLAKLNSYLDAGTRESLQQNQTELKLRLNAVTTNFTEFEGVSFDINELDPDQTDRNLDIENQYYDLVSQAEDIINSIKPQTEPRESLPSPPAQVIQERLAINLPSINLPQFSGNYTEWVSFADNIKSLFDKHKLNEFDKCHYLKLCVREEASRLITHLQTTSENFLIAWDLLEDRFYNPRLIVQGHVNNILNLQTINKGTSKDIRNLLDIVNSNLAALRSLNYPVDSWDAIVVFIILSKLDYNTKREWASFWKSKLVPELRDLISFLSNHCQAHEELESHSFKKHLVENNSKIRNFNQSNHAQNNRNVDNRGYNMYKSFNHFSQNNRHNGQFFERQFKTICQFCKNSNHNIFNCYNFLKLTNEQRHCQIANLKLCVNCLKPNNHTLDNCLSSACKLCNQKHNTLLHKDVQINSLNANTTNNSLDNATSAAISKPSVSRVIANTSLSSSEVILSTALINVENNVGELVILRALLDSGSQSSFITQNAVQRLNFNARCTPTNVSVQGINGKTSSALKSIEIEIRSRHCKYQTMVSCLVLPKITDRIPMHTIDMCKEQFDHKIKFADPNFDKPAPIDILIGNAYFWDIITTGKITLKDSKLTAQNTHLGFILAGSVGQNSNNKRTLCNVSYYELNKSLDKFFEEQQYPENPSIKLSPEQQKCEQHFADTYTKLADGKFQLKLPFKNQTVSLGDSYKTALKRFLNLENKLDKDLDLKRDYSKFINEYISLGHMELIAAPKGHNSIIDNVHNNANYYLPHHCVFKQSTTTNLRVVFDASAKSSNHLSLNDNLMVGPTLQPELTTILLNFRLHKYVLSADVKMMFRNIWIDPKHRDFQRIIWRNNSDEDLKIYKLKTVTYGTSSAPYQAVKCLMQIADDEANSFPLASHAIKTSFYMDDLLCGSNNIQQALQIRDELIHCLQKSGFSLRKWSSNNKTLLPFLKGNNEEQLINIDKQSENKTLGIIWNNTRDTLNYKLNINYKGLKQGHTKRIILSKISQIYDPLGLIGCVVVRAKLILQSLWKLNLGWDETVPEIIISRWKELEEDLPTLNNIEFPRYVLNNHYNYIELHAFSDASEKAYGTTVYLKSISNRAPPTVFLLCARSRVAPINTISIPRLELSATLLMAKLVNKLISTLSININKCFYWTDSRIVLSWLHAEPSRWKTYVANRTSEIKSLININNCYHVKGESNPADLISRGLLPKELASNDLWFNGPDWLIKENESDWKNKNIINFASKSNSIDIPEIKITSLVSIENNREILSRFSNFNKLVRVIAYCNLFIQNCKNKTSNTNLSSETLDKAKIKILQWVQLETFPKDLSNLKNNDTLHPKSNLLSLNPFLDKDGLIRVGGRLNQSLLIYNHKYPIILPKGHFVTKLIIKDAHESQLHAGLEGTLSFVRQGYWPISARNTIKEVIHKCLKCWKLNPKSYNPIMGNLPKDRVQPNRPFLYVAVDYGGPINIKEGKGRGKKLVKSYIVLFVCLSTKAIHIELATDLTSESFLNAFRRMISRRGNVAKVMSDNASNFIAASEALKNHNSTQTITWSFIPPRSPHMGGLWEINIKSTKNHLKKIIGNANLTYEEMYTTLTRIEAILNSRPLHPLSNDPNDLNFLSPGHFLIGEPINAPIENDLQEIKINRLSRWQYTERLRQDFWRRWTKDYLSQLQVRSKWQQPGNHPQIGDLVLMKNIGHPLQWPTGRIIEVHPGKDEVIRVVTVKCGDQKLYKRAVRNLCPFP